MWKHAIALSRQLQSHGGKFVLGDRRFLPHISLYHIPVNPKVCPLFMRAVKRIASRSSGGALRLRSIDMPVLKTDKPRWLIDLQRDVVDNTLEYFDRNWGAEETWDIDKLPLSLRAAGKRHLKKYGSPMMGRVFRPHITLTSFERRPTKDIPLEVIPLVFDVDEIVICELGPHHTCQRVIARYPLSSAALPLLARRGC